MTTKERILEKGRKMFNSKGIRSVSLRDIAKSLGISYGNLTYHYANKENLLTWIYIQMMEEHQEIAKYQDEKNLLEDLLKAPENSFDIACKYLFLFQDYVEIVRNYPSIAEMQKQLNTIGKSDLFGVFMKLREQGLFRSDIDEQELDYLMDRTIDLKLVYFMKLAGKPLKEQERQTGKKEFARFVNKLFYPYLTASGMKVFNSSATG